MTNVWQNNIKRTTTRGKMCQICCYIHRQAREMYVKLFAHFEKIIHKKTAVIGLITLWYMFILNIDVEKIAIAFVCLNNKHSTYIYRIQAKRKTNFTFSVNLNLIFLIFVLHQQILLIFNTNIKTNTKFICPF